MQFKDLQVGDYFRITGHYPHVFTFLKTCPIIRMRPRFMGNCLRIQGGGVLTLAMEDEEVEKIELYEIELPAPLPPLSDYERPAPRTPLSPPEPYRAQEKDKQPHTWPSKFDLVKDGERWPDGFNPADRIWIP